DGIRDGHVTGVQTCALPISTGPSSRSASGRASPMSEARPEALRGKRVLLLQGPVGPFFRRLAARLRAAGAEVHKVNFNGGDGLRSEERRVGKERGGGGGVER